MNKRFFTAIAVCLSVMRASAQEQLYLLNEGNWQTDNGKLTYFANGKVVSNQWFRDQNGEKLGDTPNDIIQVNSNLIAIAVNWSNIIQFIDANGKAVGATEDVPNNRCLATDGDFVYVTSYGHECNTLSGWLEFEKGFVAKIDVRTFKVVDAVEVGYEPEGIAYWDGHLFVANSGGYAFQEGHDYETTVNVIDTATMRITRTIDTGVINLLGSSQNGHYMLINSPGDYYENPACSVVFDCEKALDSKIAYADCFAIINHPAVKSCPTRDGRFYAIGGGYSYLTGGYEFITMTVDPEAVMASGGASGYDFTLPGALRSYLDNMAQPYDIYENPYTGYLYVTDAGGFVDAGYLYQFTPDGEFASKHKVYINPAHMLALEPYGSSGIFNLSDKEREKDDNLYNMQGIRVSDPVSGEIYIRNGNKFIFTTK